MVLSQGIDGIIQGNVLVASQAFREAQKIDVDIEIDPNLWDLLCWVGILNNQAEEILFASEKAIHSHPDWPIFRDTRGLVKAITGDFQGAIDDFEFVHEKLTNCGYGGMYRSLWKDEDQPQRQVWLLALRLGQNPITPEVLAAFRKDASMKIWSSMEEVVDEADIKSTQPMRFGLRWF